MIGAKLFVLAALASGVAIAAVLKFDPAKLTDRLKGDMEAIWALAMRPTMLSRYMSAEIYKSMGLNPSTRLMAYHWDNCGNMNTSQLLLKNITFSPDPISFPGDLTVSFDANVKTSVTAKLHTEVLLEKKIGSSWIKLPCLANIGSCTYDDLCDILDQIPSCPPQFEQAGVPCKCPIKTGAYNLPPATFEVDANFLPPGDYHIRANLTLMETTTPQAGGCYDIYASFS